MAKGLLLVTMEPSSHLEDEFNDWYDTEHVPERLALPGFETALRWVCLSGWPRWLALYDLADVATLETPEYRAVSGAKSSPWTLRILPRTIGRERVVCRQTSPGGAIARPVSETARLVAARYPGTPDEGWIKKARAQTAGLPGLAQWRAFAATDGSAETWIIAEFDRVLPHETITGAFSEAAGLGARLLNLYAPYLRGPSA